MSVRDAIGNRIRKIVAVRKALLNPISRQPMRWADVARQNQVSYPDPALALRQSVSFNETLEETRLRSKCSQRLKLSKTGGTGAVNNGQW